MYEVEKQAERKEMDEKLEMERQKEIGEKVGREMERKKETTR